MSLQIVDPLPRCLLAAIAEVSVRGRSSLRSHRESSAAEYRGARWLARLGVLVLVTLSTPVAAEPAAARLASGSDPIARQAAGVPQSELARAATEVQVDLEKVCEQQAALLNDAWLRYAVTHLAAARLASKSLVADGKANAASVSRLHNGLDEFLRALDELPKWEPGTTGWGDVKGTKKPKESLIKQTRGAFAAVKAKANRVEELREVALVVFSDTTTPEDASEHGALVMEKIEGILYDRELSQITGAGRSKTTEVVGESLKALRGALMQLGGAGNEERQDADNAKALAERVLVVRKSIEAFRKDESLLGMALPWAKPRIDLVEDDIQRLEKNLAKLKSRKS